MAEHGIIRLFKNLKAGADLVFVRSVGRFDFRIGLNQIAILLGVIFSIAILTDYLTTASPQVFNAYGVAILICHWVAFLIGAYLVTAIQRAPTMFTFFAVVILSAGLVVHIFMLVAYQSLSALPENSTKIIGPAIQWIALGWTLMIAFRAVRIVYAAGVARDLAP